MENNHHIQELDFLVILQPLNLVQLISFQQVFNNSTLLIQWGNNQSRTHTDNGGVYFNLPTAFTHIPYRIIGSVANDWDDWEICGITIDYYTITQFACMVCYNKRAYAYNFNYIAIGY